VSLLRYRDGGGAIETGRHVVDTSDGATLACCWADCERAGLLLYRVRIFEGTSPRTGENIYSWKVFCSERHKMLYVHGPRSLNRLPPGHRLAIT
jgi:hypothetical protein